MWNIINQLCFKLRRRYQSRWSEIRCSGGRTGATMLLSLPESPPSALPSPCNILDAQWHLRVPFDVEKTLFLCLPVQETRDKGSIPVSGRTPGVGNGSPPQYSCLENSMDRRDWWATVHVTTKSQTWLTDWTHTAHNRYLLTWVIKELVS